MFNFPPFTKICIIEVDYGALRRYNWYIPYCRNLWEIYVMQRKCHVMRLRFIYVFGMTLIQPKSSFLLVRDKTVNTFKY